MLKVGDRVFFRDAMHVMEVAVGRITAHNLSGGNKPFTVTTRFGEVKANERELKHSTKHFAKCLVVGRPSSPYWTLALEFCESALENQPGALDRSVDLVMFTGGEDVHPVFYGEVMHEKTHANIERDHKEAVIWAKAKRMGIPCVGICRGSQFLNVMNGGKLVQHVTNHTSPHGIITSCGHSLTVNSTHHQMMDPTPDAEILAWAEGLSTAYLGLKDYQPVVDSNSVVQEPEAVMYNETMDLCVQFHPETMPEDAMGRKYFKELVKDI